MKEIPGSLMARLRSGLATVFVFVGLFGVASTAWAQIVGTASLNIERRGHTATLLADGKILVIGGENLSGPVSQAEIFDPASQTFSILSSSSNPRTDHTATRLADGRVLHGNWLSLNVGDQVTLRTIAGEFAYRIAGKNMVKNDDLSVVAPTKREELTLITCTGTFNPITRDYSHRWVVWGERIA